MGVPTGKTARLTATAAEPDTPALNWSERSDWVNVKTDITPTAVGNGVKDDTVAIQKAFDGMATGSVLYFPAGTYRITTTLTLQLKPRDRAIASYLAMGNGTNEAAEAFRVTKGRISQKRREFLELWRVFQGEPVGAAGVA